MEGQAMHTYSLYWIKDEFSFHYFHKTNILYHFFQERYYNPGSRQLTLQYEYISQPIPLELLMHQVTHHLRKPVELHFDDDETSFTIYERGQAVKLSQREHREVEIQAENLHVAECLLFDALRKMDHSFFIMSQECQQYGWIAPVKKEVIL